MARCQLEQSASFITKQHRPRTVLNIYKLNHVLAATILAHAHKEHPIKSAFAFQFVTLFDKVRLPLGFQKATSTAAYPREG